MYVLPLALCMSRKIFRKKTTGVIGQKKHSSPAPISSSSTETKKVEVVP